MIAALGLAAHMLGAEDFEPQSLAFAERTSAYLTQDFQDPDDGSSVESFDFRLACEMKLPRTPGILLEYHRTLLRHRLGGERLDLPGKVEPTRWLMRFEEGGKPSPRLEMEDEVEYRLERVRWFVPPAQQVPQGSAWTLQVPSPGRDAVPGIRFKFQRIGASEKAVRYSVEAVELDTPNAIRATGALTVTFAPFEIVGGSWTCTRAPMPGGSSERFTVVQTLSKSKPAGL